MTTLEQERELRIGRAKDKRATVAGRELVPFVNGRQDVAVTIMRDGQPTTLFNIEIHKTTDGFQVRRQGEKLDDTLGVRVFLVPTAELNTYYARHTFPVDNPNHAAENFFAFLKSFDAGRRLVRENGDPISMAEPFTIIVKKISVSRGPENETSTGYKKNRWDIPDLMRIQVGPDGSSRIFTEQVVVWDGERRLNLTSLGNDAQRIRFIEDPWVVDADNHPRNRNEDLSEKEQKARRLSIEMAQNTLPATNTVVLTALREKARQPGDGPAAWPVEFFIEDNFLKIVRHPGYYGDGYASVGPNAIYFDSNDIPAAFGIDSTVAVALNDGVYCLTESYSPPNYREGRAVVTIEINTDAQGRRSLKIVQGIAHAGDTNYVPKNSAFTAHFEALEEAKARETRLREVQRAAENEARLALFRRSEQTGNGAPDQNHPKISPYSSDIFTL